MFERATRKLGLDQAIFMSGAFKLTNEFSSQEKKLSKNEIEILLRKGILGLVQAEGLQTMNDTVEGILSSSSRTAKYSLINGTYTI
jgi:chromodomain-helicase-DNA-binding protein 7